ncbi:TPA: endonuclease MutS2 [Candidatus Poribacteria bacterium]|nr:endonuclease MutS2 [Candidatus Poribacteria bacterium]
MNTEIEKTLEFDKIKSAIASFASSELGKSLAEELKPITDVYEINRQLDICSEAKTINLVEGGFPLSGLYDIRKILKKASVVGSVLDPEELLQVASTARVARNLKAFIKDLSDRYPLIYEIIDNLNTFSHIEETIANCLDHEGNVLDNASPELLRIRRQTIVVRDRITKQLASILRSPQYQPAIQEDVITLRNDRYVIPVKQSLKGSVPGVIQGRSASGITAFVEPNSVVELNNELHELLTDEKLEIKRILREITEEIRQVLTQFENTVQILAELDLINAKSLFCIRLGTSRPEINERGYINLIQARHPILQMKINERSKSLHIENDPNLPEKVVPIDFYIGDSFKTLVITGPNTGGKTVALKTIGLLTIMMQAGLHVPVKEGSQMSVFKEVFADIGDEQSIEQNLSTFSSHITRIIKIIEQLDEPSLVLLDELGAGTEPSEGSALGMAILDFLHSKGVITIATTHHDSLKAHVYSQEGMENASMAFDLNTLKPTYELRIGLPGSSNALKIADRLGLPKDITEKAKEYINPQNARITDLLLNVEDMQRSLEEQKRLAEEKTRSATKTQQEQEILLNQIKSKRKEMEKKALDEAGQIVQKAQLLVENVIAEIQKEKTNIDNAKRARKRLEKAQNDIASEIKRLSYSDMADKKPIDEVRKPNRDELKLGDEVYIEKLRTSGILSSMPDSKDIVQVIAGNAKINIPLSEIMIKSNKGEKKIEQAKTNAIKFQISKQPNISNILDIRGFRAYEAIEKTDKFLDDAVIANLKTISIIHGLGTGALRKAISELLSEHPLVASFHSADKNEGGQGVTIVELR